MIKLAPNICKLVRWVANMENTTLSKTDRNILAAMRADARMSITELAAATGTSPATANTRLDALKATGRIRTLTKIPEVSTIYSTNGAWDLVVEIKTDSLVRFDYVLREIREVPGVLNSESCLLLSRVTS